MFRERTKDEHIARLTERMIRDYGESCDAREIADAVRTDYEELCSRSRIHAFVPILAERQVRQRLRRTQPKRPWT